MDTFPTPAIVGAWPDIVVANHFMGYTFKNDSKYKANATNQPFHGLDIQEW